MLTGAFLIRSWSPSAAKSKPSPPPATAKMSPSAKNCRANRRADAPSAERTATSCVLPMFLTSIRLARLTQIMRSTKPAATISIQSARCAGPRMTVFSGLSEALRSNSPGAMCLNASPFRAMRPSTTLSCARACPGLTSGFNRATTSGRIALYCTRHPGPD